MNTRDLTSPPTDPAPSSPRKEMFMAFGIRLLVWGDYASFNRPEMKVERVSYDVMTPSAARGILEAIHWKPAMRWVVDVIHVLNPIQSTSIRRNELKGTIPTKGALAKALKGEPAALGLDIGDSGNRAQRASAILKDVRYGIEAHVEIVRPDVGPDGQPLAHPEAKHLETFKRRAARGQFFHQPYFGTREFPADFTLVDAFPPCPPALRGEHRLGWMLHDMAYTPNPKGGTIVESNEGRRLHAEARFFDAVMRDGVIVVPPLRREGDES